MAALRGFPKGGDNLLRSVDFSCRGSKGGMDHGNLCGVNAPHAFEAESAGGFRPAFEALHVGDISESRVDSLDAGGTRGIDEAGAGVNRFAALGSFGNAQIGGVVLESDGKGGDALGCSSDGAGVLDPDAGLEDRHQPDGPADLMANLEFLDHVVDLSDLTGMFDLGDQNEV